LEDLNKNLIELNVTKDKFFSIIAHDLKNPLGSFKSVTELLAESYNELSDEDKIDFVHLLRDSSKNIYSLLENLLEWSSAQRGSIPFNLIEINLKLITIEIIKLLTPSAEKKFITIKNNISALIIIEADVNMLKTIIRNLISNAIKFTPENGIITLDSFLDDNNCLISISDTGIGMNRKTQDKLFRIDAQTTTLGTNEETGTGLGLILCQEFVEKHGGKIWVESEEEKGSTFYFSLPKPK
jgi:signal transduction histidine kinase